MANVIKQRGDFDAFNLAKYLYARTRHLETGHALKDLLGPDSFEYNWMTSKAQSELNGQDGGFLAPEEWNSQFFDIIRDESAFRSLPVDRVLTKYRVQKLAVATSEWSFNYLGDNASPTSADRKFSQRTWTMHKAIGLRTVSNELLRDAQDWANRDLVRSAGQAVAFEQDAQSLIGTGLGGKPTGLLFETNAGSIDAAGATPTEANLATMIGNAKQLNNSTNVPPGSTVDVAVVANPQIEQTVRAYTTPGNTNPWLWGLGDDPFRQFLGAKWVLTASIPITFTNTLTPTGSNQTQLFAGNWKYLRVVTRSDFEFKISPEAGSSTAGFGADQSFIRVVFRYDVACTHPEAFCFIKNAIK